MSQAVQAHVSRKSKRLIDESATRFVTRYLFTRGNRWEFKHLIRNSMGKVIWLIYNGKYFETWTFYELIVCFFSRREPGLPVELYEYRKKIYFIIDSNDYNVLENFIFRCSRSLPSLLKPEWSQSKHKIRNTAIKQYVLWQTTRWWMVSFCRSCRNKTANNSCARKQMCYSLVRLVEWWTSYSGTWWSSQRSLL